HGILNPNSRIDTHIRSTAALLKSFEDCQDHETPRKHRAICRVLGSILSGRMWEICATRHGPAKLDQRLRCRLSGLSVSYRSREVPGNETSLASTKGFGWHSPDRRTVAPARRVVASNLDSSWTPM